jgi:multidrug resistance efflux pump
MTTQLKELDRAAVEGKTEVATPSESNDVKKEEPKKRGFRISKKPLLLALILLILVPVGYQVYQHLITYQETDDAYITAHVIPISSRIEDNVDEVLIDDNEHVKKGQLIVRDYKRKLLSLAAIRHSPR